MKYCPDCGTKLQTGTKLCTKCDETHATFEKIEKPTTIDSHHNQPAPNSSPTRIWPWFLGIFILGALAVGAFLLFDAVATGGTITGSAIRAIQPPDPYVTDVQCEGYGLDYRVKVAVTVENYGGDGNVRVIGKLDQTDARFDNSKEQTIYMSKNEVRKINFDFDASGFRSWKCSGNAYST